MREHLKKRDEIRGITKGVLQTYGKLDPKLQHLDVNPLPDKNSVINILGDLLDSIYFRLCEEIYHSVRPDCAHLDNPCKHCDEISEDQTLALLRGIPALRRQLAEDVQAGYDGDPAAKSTDEVIFAYPAIYAISVYRIAHELSNNGIPLLPRIMTEFAHSKTGIDIHPGARIGRGFFIDHGTGVVIGETTIIGDNVKVYQGVTIGAMSFAKDEEGQLVRGRKRHPTTEDNVVIYSGATILGGETIIG
jgi:serine O-acetyltransferase